MDIAIQARNVVVSDSLRAIVTEKIGRLARFLDGMERADVCFKEERNPRIAEREVCEVTVHGHGHVVRARAAAHDAAAAVDRVVDKLEHRIEKLRGKLLHRSHRRRPTPPVEALVLPDDAEVEDGPRIVKRKGFTIKPMTPEEAALQMELVGHDFYFFMNAETDKAAVVYKRGDGHIGLIDAT